MKSSAIYTPNAYEVICRVARMASSSDSADRGRSIIQVSLGHVIFLLIYFRFGSHIVEDFEVP